MRILVACEESQAVTIEMRRLGHEAYSCDIQECSGGHPEWHIKGDVIPLLNGNCRFQTMDGEWHEIVDRWDMIIAHPPCTDLASSGARHFAQKRADGRQQRSIAFFMAFVNADCERIAIENPIGIMRSQYRKPDQIAQPWMFGHGETKATCFWLKGLKPLVPTKIVEGREQRVWRMPPSPDRARLRSKTYPGIARAMAEQWAGPCYPDYVQRSIERLKAFEPQEGYFVAFSGGKDSQCIYHLCEMAGVKFDAHYSVTSVDPPELVRFIREKYPNVAMEIPHDKDGKPITMWTLIANRSVPPTRRSRYCCTEIKECNGRGRITVTGVRWAESKGRTENRGPADIDSKSKKLQKTMEENGADFRIAKAGHIVLNDDNDINRRMVEQCYRTHKTMVNPIVDWSDQNVWDFLKNVAKVESCSLYAEGFDRLGCIGCPLASKKNRIEEFERWPKYKSLYLKAFQRMIENRTEHRDDEWKTPEEVFDWWMETGVLPGQIRMDELMEE